MKQKTLWIVFLVCLFSACTLFTKKSPKDTRTIYGIYTKFGVMKVVLFDETPAHKANFEKLVQEGFYDSTLFHRVIKNFMIQGGDPDSKNAPKGKMLGMGGPNYTIPAEFNDTLVHLKGMLAAARQGDQVNPTKASSGSQFYIVQGQKITEEQLSRMEQIVNAKRMEKGKYVEQLFQQRAEDPTIQNLQLKINQFAQSGQRDSFNLYRDKIIQLAEENMGTERFTYTPFAKAQYLSIGGTPNLDTEYTVFGKVIEGLAILDSIAAVKTTNERPTEDILITIKKIN